MNTFEDEHSDNEFPEETTSLDETVDQQTGFPESTDDSMPVEGPVSKTFPCPRCGADIIFDISSQKLKCPYCEYEQDLSASDKTIEERDYHAMLTQLEERKTKNTLVGELHEFTCSSCGGTVVFQGAMTSTRCPYCDTPTQRNDIHDAIERIIADGVIAFQVDRENVKKRLEAWVRSLWFAPNNFKKRGINGQFDGIYLPFWTFDSMTANAYWGKRGDNYTVTVGSGKNRRTETRTRWSSRSGEFQRFFDDVLVLAADGFPVDLINQLRPWPLIKTIPFNDEVLAGFLASTYTLKLDHGFELARLEIDEALRADVRGRIGGDKQVIDRLNTTHHAITFKYVLLPVWSMTYKYQNKVYTLVVNGVTGKVAGNRPWSTWKIAFTVLFVAAIVGTFIYFMNNQ